MDTQDNQPLWMAFQRKDLTGSAPRRVRLGCESDLFLKCNVSFTIMFNPPCFICVIVYLISVMPIQQLRFFATLLTPRLQ